MKKLFYLFAFLAFAIFSCSDDSYPGCDVRDVSNLPWLQELIEARQEGDHTITMGTYNSQTVFVVSTCCAVCNMSPPPVYACGGNVVGTIGYGAIMLDEITDKEVVWKSADDTCGMG